MSSARYEVQRQPYSKGQPSSYYPAPQKYQPHQQHRNVELENVVTNQPYPVMPSTPVDRSKPKVLIFAITMTAVIGVFLFLPGLCCIIPGLVMAIVAHDLVGKPEHVATAKALNGVSLCCNITGLFAFVIFLIYVLGQVFGSILAADIITYNHYSN